MNGYRLAQAILRRLDPETAHDLTLWLLRRGLGPVARAPDDPILATRVWGREVANPIGLAAGFDKNAAVAGPMLRLGFGFIEVGSITPAPQPGNPRPRVFRLAEDEAVINRLGFPSEGMAVAAAPLTTVISEPLPPPLGLEAAPALGADLPPPAPAGPPPATEPAVWPPYAKQRLKSAGKPN